MVGRGLLDLISTLDSAIVFLNADVCVEVHWSALEKPLKTIADRACTLRFVTEPGRVEGWRETEVGHFHV